MRPRRSSVFRSAESRFARWWSGLGLAAVVLLALAGCSAREPAPRAPEGMLSSTTSPAFVFPVVGDATYTTTHAGYPAADIMAECGLPIRSVTDATILEVNRVDRWRKATDEGAWRGGMFVSTLGDDGVRYYYAHFSAIAAGLAPGQRVAAGQGLGSVGTTGRSGACHLHFGISPPCARTGDWPVRRGVIWPGRYLSDWRKGIPTSAAPEAAAWSKVHACVVATPATGTDS